jgi:EAL domain-containing protein (putative c-di-GMP-specific phosphodiesterase class I)
MFYEYAYEIVAVVFLLLVVISYARKNWLDLKVNRCFHQLLCAGILFTILDIGVHILAEGVYGQTFPVRYALAMIPSSAMIVLGLLLFQYFMALFRYLPKRKSWKSAAIVAPAILMCLLIFTTPLTHLVFYYDASHSYREGALIDLVTIVMDGYIFGCCALAFFNKRERKLRHGIVCIAVCIICNIAIVLQYTVLQRHYLLSFYAFAFMILTFYLMFQNLDRYSDRMSGGFSRAGFRKVLREKFVYRERFSCLFVTIQNYQNIMSISEENELSDVTGEIGRLLRKCGGHHNQFHIHGSDFAVLQKREEESVKLYEEVSKALPSSVRINNRKIPVSYGYYMLTLEEAAYDQDEFYKMFTSMKKMLRQRPGDNSLMRYQGEVQKNIDLELHISRLLKQIMQKKRCDICFYPIMDMETGERHALEARIYMLRDNGTQIPEGAIWAVAREMGYIRELGRITLESAMELAMEERILEHGFQKMVMNVTPLHISSENVIREYQFLARKYQFPLNRLCLELTEDMSISFDQMEKYLGMLKEQGVSLILDSYGDSVCNLQGIMRMPFNIVKISERMVQRYCAGESDILKYQIQMLCDNGWNICLEGVNDAQNYEKVRGLSGISYIQGEYCSLPVLPSRMHIYMEES